MIAAKLFEFQKFVICLQIIIAHI